MSTLSPQGRSRGATIGLGALIALTGAVLLAWPGATTLVLVSWLGLAIGMYGVFEIVNGFSGAGDRSRLWSFVLGAIALIGGLVIFFTPVVSSVTVGLVIGWYWIIGGIMGLVGAFVVPGDRFVRGLVGAVSLLAGIVVLAQPGLSLVALVWFSGAWMLVAGLFMMVSALFLRSRRVAAA